MSITPPSDIVMDVARAADPVRYREAAAKLSQPGDPAAFGSAVQAVGLALQTPLDPRATLAALQGRTAAPPADAGSTPTDPYKKFEGLVLQQLIEAMMPEKSETVFGKGNAGGIWKSMFAEQIGAQVARAGGLGIARMLSASRPAGPVPAAPVGTSEAKS